MIVQWRFLKTFRSRLLLLVLLAVVPALGLALLTGIEQRRTAAEAVQARALRTTHLAVEQQDRLLQQTRLLLTEVATLPAIRRDTGEACREILGRMREHNGLYSNFALAQLDGTVTCSSVLSSATVSVSDRLFFQRVVERHELATGEYTIGRISGRPTLLIGAPVLDEVGAVRAVLYAGLDLDWLRELAREPELPVGARLTITLSTGEILARYPDPGPPVGQPGPSSIGASPLDLESASTGRVAESVGADSSSWLFASAPLGEGAIVTAEIPRELAYRDANRALAWHLATLGGVALLALLAAGLFSERFLTRDLQMLSRTSERLAAGDLSARSRLEHAVGELADLSRHFDGMAEALQLREAERKQAEQALRQSEAQYRQIVELAQEGIWQVDANNRTLFANPKMAQMFGCTVEEMLGLTMFDFMDDDAKLRAKAGMERRRHGVSEQYEVRYRRRDGTPLWAIVAANPILDEAGQYAGAVAMLTDITERKRTAETLEHQALHDVLTDLPNRVLILNRIGKALARARSEASVAVLFLDLDNFKVINDSLSHEAGDRLLMAVAKRLRGCLRVEDALARLGGDEFTILLEDVAHPTEATGVAERIGEALRDPFDLDGHQAFISTSIGIALGGTRDHRPDQLLQASDIAMYHAKASGKGRHTLYDPSMGARVAERLARETDLRRAIDQGELRVYYQPIVSLASGRISEVEALVRWAHPERGLVMPMDFIPLAEETGLIVPLGRWVLDEACRQVRAWHQACPTEPPLTLNVNLSPRQFQDPGLLQDIRDVLARTTLDPRTLQFEITETMVMDRTEATMSMLHALKAHGIRLAIDDFGTGHSALGYLKHFPVDSLKIDQSFVKGLGRVREDTAIVRAVLAFARALGVQVTAEGIETVEQCTELRTLTCDRGQGYFFARPLPAHELRALLGRSTMSLHQATLALQPSSAA